MAAASDGRAARAHLGAAAPRWRWPALAPPRSTRCAAWTPAARAATAAVSLPLPRPRPVHAAGKARGPQRCAGLWQSWGAWVWVPIDLPASLTKAMTAALETTAGSSDDEGDDAGEGRRRIGHPSHRGPGARRRADEPHEMLDRRSGRAARLLPAPWAGPAARAPVATWRRGACDLSPGCSWTLDRASIARYAGLGSAHRTQLRGGGLGLGLGLPPVPRTAVDGRP